VLLRIRLHLHLAPQYVVGLLAATCYKYQEEPQNYETSTHTRTTHIVFIHRQLSQRERLCLWHNGTDLWCRFALSMQVQAFTWFDASYESRERRESRVYAASPVRRLSIFFRIFRHHVVRKNRYSFWSVSFSVGPGVLSQRQVNRFEEFILLIVAFHLPTRGPRVGARGTGLNVLAKNRRNWHSISSIQASKSQKRDFRHVSWGKSVLFKWKCQIREFHARGMERGEVLRRYCGWQKEAKLLKQKLKDRTFIHAAGTLQ